MRNIRKFIFKLYEKFRKKKGNDMVADVAQWKCSNIKYYASAFSNIYIEYRCVLLSFGPRLWVGCWCGSMRV